ncbi:MAG: response regulator [Bermanella sp.]
MSSESVSSQKSALVVDDSKLARYVLKEMLIAHDIAVETAESAEEALGILSAHKPDVIFMDHMMPGMDGFQAVQAIKNDPSTAKIPILMYTSKDEGVYVNQARALGAVGVLPKKLKPVQLERVLQQLKLIPFTNDAAMKATLSSASKQSSLSKSEQPTSEPGKAAISQTSHTLEELSRSASEDLEKDSMRQLFRQLFLEQRDGIKQDQHELLETMVKEVRPAVTQMGKQGVRWQKWGLGLTAAILLGVAGLWLKNDDGVLPKIEQLTQVQMNTSEKTDQLLNKLNASVIDSAGSPDVILATQTLQWALNQNNQLAFQEPLTSLRIQNHMSELLLRLEQEGFNGTLSLRYHAGNYCEKNESGEFSLANNQAALTQCIKRSDLDWAEIGKTKNWEALVEQWNNTYNGFYIEFEYMGSRYTQQEYPVIVSGVDNIETARNWNAIAAVNHRLEYVLQ